jgi:hypothetical protein
MTQQDSNPTPSNGSNADEDKRGLLDIKVTLSNPDPVAGGQFTVYLEVTNTLGVPIWPELPQVFLPSELKANQQRKTLSDLPERVESLSTEIRTALPQPEGLWKYRPFAGIYRFLMQDACKQVGALADAATTLDKHITEQEQERETVRQTIAAKTNGKTLTEKLTLQQADEEYRSLLEKDTNLVLEIDKCTSRLAILRNDLVILTDSPSIVSEGDIELMNFSYPRNFYVQAKGDVRISSPFTGSLEALSSASQSSTDALQPGSTAIYSLVLKTRNNLLFRPLQYQLEYSLNYSFDPSRKNVHTNKATQLLTIRAPISSVMVGAMVGGLVGHLIRVLPVLNTNASSLGDVVAKLGASIIPLFVTVMLSAMAVVFVTRRAEVQTFITVEDFWGGSVIGFLVGYVGTDFFNNLAKISPQPPGATPVPTLTPTPGPTATPKL